MQEFQPIPGLAGRLFGGAAESAGLLRRGGAAAVPEEVRCPRCDSANTKFCYYNNYNLSQPRHFCKGCRRYWTKGGLLRNVPVGGGCRKPKRKAASTDVDKDASGANSEAKNVRSGCSAGNSSLTSAASSASTNTVDDVGAIAAAHAAAHSSGGRMLATGLGPRTFMEDAPPVQPPTPMFAEQAAAFASLFGTPLPAFTFSAQRKAEDDVAPAVTLTLTEQPSSASSTADMASFSVRSTGEATASASDWPPATVIDAGIFDLAGAVGSDTTSYWNTASWTDPDGTVYLP